MARPQPSPGASLLASWRRLSGLPGGDWLFSRALGRRVPYSATIGARIVHLEPGRCRATLPDRRRVRNHLASIHAVALTNLGELVGGLAMLTALPEQVRGIPVRLDTTYLKKARGRLVADCHCSPPSVQEPVDFQLTTHIRDGDDDEVARVTATWRLDRRGSP